MIYGLLLILGITAGLRAAVPLAAVAFGACVGWIGLAGTWAGFAGSYVAVAILAILMVLEMIRDQLPSTGSRKDPSSLVLRGVAGALACGLLGLPSGTWIAGIVLGIVGALIGTFAGYEVRRMLAKAIGRDLPAALIEDVAAVVLAVAAVYLAR